MRNLPPLPKRARLQRALTVSNVLATLALFLALTGTSFAAIVLTGANVRNSTLTGADFKNLTLGAADFSFATANALKVRGAVGPTGAPGATGAEGPAGLKGPVGAKGNDAPRAYTFLTRSQHSRVMPGTSNPPTAIPVFDCDNLGDDPFGCTGVNSGSPYRFPRWSFRCNHFDGSSSHCFTQSTSAPQLTRSFNPIMVSSQQLGGGLLDLPYDGTIVLNASATFYTQLTPTMQRLTCQLEVARVENGVPQAPESVGEPMSTSRYMSASSRNLRERLMTIAVTGAVSKPAGIYETQMSCHSPDDTGQSTRRLEFIEGNLSVLSTRNNGNG